MRFTSGLILSGALALGALAATTVGAAQEKAKCPVMKVEFQPNAKSKTVMVNGQKLAFCCAGCDRSFAASPEKYVSEAGSCPVNRNGKAKVAKESRAVVNNGLYYFCCGNCAKALTSNPGRFVKELVDPVSGKSFAPAADSPRLEVEGQIYIFAGPESKAAFEQDKAKYLILFK